MSWFSIRRVILELEAKLSAADGAARGKIECKCYADGAVRLKLKLRGTGLPDGSDMSVRIAGEEVATATANGGDVWLDREGPLPDLQSGDLVEVVYKAMPVATGSLRPD